jgi:hypothetical protein
VRHPGLAEVAQVIAAEGPVVADGDLLRVDIDAERRAQRVARVGAD